MKRSFLIVFALFLTGYLHAQTVQVSLQEDSNLILNGQVGEGGVEITEHGKILQTAKYAIPDQADPSLKAYVLPNGSVIVRENIANFLFYDSFGIVQRSVSNSTQSEGGEAISELAMDPMGKTVVLYNPKVVSGGETGSRAQKVSISGSPVNLFYSQDRILSHVHVSVNGAFIAFVSAKSGTDDEVQLMDRFGNILTTISFDQEVKGVTFSENGLYATIYSGGRVASYEIRSGDRVGSTSVRNTSVLFAAFSPADQTIIVITGNGSSTYSNLELRAVNIEARKIATREISGSIMETSQPNLRRNSRNSFTIEGYDKTLTVRASF